LAKMTSYAEMARQRKRARPLYLELRALGLGLRVKGEAYEKLEGVLHDAGLVQEVREVG